MGLGAMTTVMLRLPLTATLLATLLFASDGLTLAPLIIVAVVVAYAVAAWVHVATWRARIELFHWDAGQAAASCPKDVGRALNRPFTWSPEKSTLVGLNETVMPAMPPIAQLTEGLDGMLA